MAMKNPRPLFVAVARNTISAIKVCGGPVLQSPGPSTTLAQLESVLSSQGGLDQADVKAAVGHVASLVKALAPIKMSTKGWEEQMNDVAYHAAVLLKLSESNEPPPSYPPGPELVLREIEELLEQRMLKP
jgi:hypothetical protein